MQDRVAVAVPPAVGVTLDGVIVQTRPVDGLIVSVRATAWLKVPWEVTVSVEVPATPFRAVTLVGLAVRVKFAEPTTVTAIVVELVSKPFRPP